VADNFSFSVVLESQQDGRFTVLVPALPEIVTEGDTKEEALANAEEAIRASSRTGATTASQSRPTRSPRSAA